MVPKPIEASHNGSVAITMVTTALVTITLVTTALVTITLVTTALVTITLVTTALVIFFVHETSKSSFSQLTIMTSGYVCFFHLYYLWPLGFIEERSLSRLN